MVATARSSPPVRSGVTNASPYRVVIIEDSAVIRGMMSRWLTESGDFEVVARYGTAASALGKLADVEAEVVILDVDAPKLDGVDLLPKLIGSDSAIKILAVTTSRTDKVRGESALRAIGATGVLERSSVMREVTTSKDFPIELIRTVKSLGLAFRNDNKGPRSKKSSAPAFKANVSSGMRKATPIPAKDPGYSLAKHSSMKPQILAIGSSTGGPKALYEVFSSMKSMLDVPVLITQHMPPLFTSILAEHLTKASGMPAREGEHGERVLPGRIYVAPGDKHMVLTGTQNDLRIELNQGPEENFCRPSVDPLFRSVARIFGNRSLCLVLTGMGQDGCNGAKDVVTAGGTVIGQDEETSVVWGMPGAVAKAGLCAEIIPLTKIGPRVTSLLKGVVK